MAIYNTKNFYGDYSSHFGGIIYPSDFNTDYPNSHNMANRIANDLRFDEQCRKNEIKEAYANGKRTIMSQVHL